ncbi:MAG: hypothetical protein GY814_06570 [Gammaproteobacteria bacterium]|nr:hypothetical protein [Gammaproteobacteria bacterium]
MSTKYFGQYLFEKGLINREQLLEALDEQRKSSPLLGDIAVEKGWIDAKQSKKINMEQRRQDKRFGEIAIELSLLDESEINKLLDEQKSRRKYFGEILVELGHLSALTLEEQLKTHKEESLEFDEQISLSFKNSKLPSQSIFVNEMFIRFYQRMIKIMISTTEVIDGKPADNNENLFWSQEIQSDKNYYLILGIDVEHACHIAKHFMGIEVKEMDELGIDSVAEFLNTFTGHVYSELSQHTQPKVQAPQYHGNHFEVALSPCTTLQFDSGQFPISIAVGVKA